jgi:mannose-1-phosphate guanylyltransferase
VNRAALILAGGAGTRLWPLSSDDNPKQFLPLFGGQSLLQRTWSRVVRLVPPQSIFISTNERYRQQCLDQLPDLQPANVLTEPSRRNTAPAIALCCFEIETRLGDATIAVLPSDHYIGNEDAFLDVLGRAFAFASATDFIVTVGIEPTEANTGYGYLELGPELEAGVVRLRRFTEKPSRERAEELLRAGNYAWNGGMFIWRASIFRRELTAAAPELSAVSRATYETMPSISIDYALMEKAPNVATIRGDFDWSDVGSWAAVARLSKGSAALHTSEAVNVYAHSSSGRPVVAVGVSNIAIIESPEGILVLDLSSSEALAGVVRKLNEG